MRVALYFRQSLDNAEGIERQQERCRALATARGWEVVREYTDNAVSASKDRSEATWGQLLDGVKSGEFEVVVATKVDRLARRVRDILDLTEAGVQIATVEGDIDTTTETGKFQAVLLTALAQLEAERKGARHREAHASRAAKGMARTNKRAYGWKSDGMALEPVEADHLRTALTNILEGSSIRAEVRRMNDAGARTVKYKSGSGGLEWTPRTLTMTLDRERMAGILMRNGERQPVSKITPIVTEEQWEKYRALRKDPTRLTRERADGSAATPLKHFMTGVPLCPCGQRLIATPSRRGDTSVPYYQCPARAGSKGHVSIAAGVLESRIKVWLYGHMSGGHVSLSASGERVKELRERLTELAGERAEETDNLAIKGVDKGRIRTRLAAIDAEAQRLSGELETALADDLGAEWLDRVMAAGEDSAESAEGFLAWFDGLDVATRRALVKANAEVRVMPGQAKDRVKIEPLTIAGIS